MPVVSDKDRRALKGFSLDGRGRKHVPSPAEKRRRLIILLICVMLFVVAVLVTVGIIIPLLDEPAEMAENTSLNITAGKRGSLELSWDPARRTSGYRLILFSTEEGEERQLYERFCRSAKCTLRAADLSALPENRQVGVRIIARDFLYFLEKSEEQTEPAEVSFFCTMNEPVIKDARGQISVDDQSVTLKWTGWESDTYTLYLKDSSGNREMIREIRGSNAAQLEQKQYDETISYGPRGSFKIPKDDKDYTLEMEVAREQPGVTFQGADVEFMNVNRIALMSRDVEVVCDRLEDNRYRISWNDIGSFAYAVEILRPGAADFEQIKRVDGSEDLVCETGEHLKAGRQYTFRVRALSADEVFDDAKEASFGFPAEADTKQGETASTSQPGVGTLTVVTGESTLYANIWPTKALDVWADVSRSEKVGSVSVGKCLCVLEEDAGSSMFRVRVDDSTEGYIDSNYCMINLPDYLGDLCQYDIPNSYASIYMVNGYYIPNVTGTVTPGYEDVLLDDNTFLVPLLYPVAVKLADAAEATLENGYRIEINDSFRPHVTTRYIYDETNKVLYWKLPDIKYDGFKTTFKTFISNGRTVSEPPLSALPPGAVERSLAETVDAQEQTADVQAEGAVLEQTAPENAIPATENARYTYYWEMTNGTYRLGSFLAAGASRHNIGVAMDMTLVSVQDDYRHLDMQTDMHNLSWHSAMSYNNINADILKKYLTNAGFATIGSEWWHFQDNDVTSSLNPPIVENGVNVEGWKKDDNGWRYRDRKGNYLSSQTAEIEGVAWTFDPEGYVVGQ